MQACFNTGNVDMEFKELTASGSLNRANYDHYVGIDSRSVESTEHAGEVHVVTHYHGNCAVGRIYTHRPTGKTSYMIRIDK